jgi:SAM-dependent methyltransferase
MAFPYYKQHWIDVDKQRMEAYGVVLQYHPRLEPMLAPLELTPGLSVLDVGCGPGYVTAELARRVGETGKAVGIDINKTFVAAARAHAEEKGVGRIASFQQGDFPPLPFPDRSFDRILCKNVLEYVDSAEATLKEIARALKRSGKALVLDSDWDMLALDVSDPDLSDRILSAVKRTAVREPRIGRQLPRLFKAAGFADIKVNVIAGADLSGWAMPMLEKSWSQYALASGGITQAELDRWLGDLRERVAKGEYFFCLPQFVVSATV